MKAVLSLLIVLFLTSQRADAEDRKTDYRKLVEGLASPNAPIKCTDDDDTTISIPPNYDWDAQKRIEENRRLLFAHCGEALPFLIDGCTDARYSLTSRWQVENTYSWCIGEICLEIIAHHVEVFREHMSFDGPGQWHWYDFVPRLHTAIGKAVTDGRKKEIRDWWRKRRDKSLHELQIEAFDWAIEKRTEEVNRLSRENHGANLAGDKSEASDEIKSLIAARDGLRRSGKCLPPQKMWPSILSPKGYTIVPWTEQGEGDGKGRR